jgi:hypothetical protein
MRKGSWPVEVASEFTIQIGISLRSLMDVLECSEESKPRSKLKVQTSMGIQ